VGDLFDDDLPSAGEEPEAVEWEALFEYSARAYDAAASAGMSELPVVADINRYVRKVLAAAREAAALAGGTGGERSAEAQLAAREAADRAATDRGDPAVRAVFAAAFKVDKEIERMTGMLRFSPGKDGLYLACCAPDHFVLPALAGHFKSRFGDRPWAIIDEKRGIRLIRRPGEEPRLDYCPGTEPEKPEEEGDGWEKLWRIYHRSINIENRKNPELQKRFMPLRYRKYLTELKQ
jgi:probable DNA metabolism protein